MRDLVQLISGNCCHHYIGARSLGELLKCNNSLEELDMRWNDIGDDGMSLVADGLKLNRTLTKLDIRECGLTAEGMIIYTLYVYSLYNTFTP